MVVTVSPALAMQNTLNVSNYFILILPNEQKKTLRDASTRRKSTASATLG